MKKKTIIIIFIILISIKVYSDRKKIARSLMRIRGRLKLRNVEQVIKTIDNKLSDNKLKNISENTLKDVTNLAVLAFKKERIVEFWLKKNNKWILNHKVNIKGASGILGPKFKEGDKQVPEGIYPITFLHPNSKFNISVKIGYPNKEDKERSSKLGIKDFGGNIFIHNTDASIGCIALGELYKVEEFFYICYKLGIKNCKTIICPVDFRKDSFKTKSELELDKKYSKLYDKLRKELKNYNNDA